MKSTVASFREQYQNTPGIVGIKKYKDIIVFIDKTKLKSILPSSFEDEDILYFDIIGMKDMTSAMIKHLKSNNINLTDEQNKKTFDYLIKTNKICKKLLQNEVPSKT